MLNAPVENVAVLLRASRSRSRLRRPRLREIVPDGGLHDRLDRLFIGLLVLRDIDRPRLAQELRVEELLRVRKAEPAENASLTRSLRMIPTHTIPSCDQTAEPSGLLGRFHFTSSAISGSASWTILRSFASIAPRQSRVFAISSSTGPARVMSAPHSFVYRVSAVPAAHGADVIASRRAAIDARV